MDNPFTRQIAEFIAHTRLGDLPDLVVERSKACLFDGLGLSIGGIKAKCTQILYDLARSDRLTAEASVLGTGERVPECWAALINGTAAHADDYDDTQLASLPDRVSGLLVHPTTPVLNAALAVAERTAAGGRDLLTAYNVGVEVECKLAEAIHPDHYKRGFHSTGTLGALGATAAAASLLGLSGDQTLHALGIAASMCAGLRANFGTMTKPLHAGRAAENGVFAARLAHRGYTASPDILDSRWGFFSVMGGGFDQKYLNSRLANPYQIESPGIAIKPYPCGFLSHPLMDATLKLTVSHDIRPEDVQKVEVGTASNILNALRYTRPQSELEAKFSLSFLVGIIILRRRAGLPEFRDETVQSPEVQSFLRKVHCHLDPEVDRQGYEKARGWVKMKLVNGQVLEKQAETARGYPDRPLTPEEQLEKFRECTDGLLNEDRISSIWERVQQLESIPDVQELLEWMRPDRQGRSG